MPDANALTPAGRPIYDSNFNPVQPNEFGTTQTPTSRWVQKANAFATAWGQKYKTVAPVCLVCDALAVAQHETLCGDAWPNEFNWGALQLRTLRIGEIAALTGIVPSPANVKAARVALVAGVAAGAFSDEPNGALHVDSSPGKGWYWVFFRKCANDIDGASFFIQVLCGNRPGCLSILKSATQDWHSDCFDLASAMYATHYFEGFRIPTQMYTGPDGKQVTGVVMNELDYSGSLEKIAPIVFDALQGWQPPAILPQFDLTTVQGVQSALTFLAGKYGGRWQRMDPQGVDGKLGPLTRAALLEFQDFMSVPKTGQIDAQTVAVLRTALDKAQG
jgi:hypothetical protein